MLEYSLLNEAYPILKKKINKNISNVEKCEPIQTPVYSVPISNETKNKYNEIYEVSMMYNNNNDSNYKFYDEETSKDNKIKPFFNDEIYTSINDDISKNTNTSNNPNNINYDNILNVLNNIKKKFTNDDKELKNFYDMLINLSFFIFIGLIIILLCDQITKLSNVIYIKELYNSINNNI